MDSERRLLTLLIATSPLWATQVRGQLVPPVLSVEPNGFPSVVAPVGFASINALGQNGTTGGGLATPTVVTTKSALDSAVSGNNPKVVHISGRITGSGKTFPGSNTTILGLGATAELNGFSTTIDDEINIILQNLKFDNPSSDMISAGSSEPHSNNRDSLTHHIWVDHCTFVGPGGDGSIDTTQGSTLWTFSWNHFIRCNKVLLSGRGGGSPFPYERPGTGRGTEHHNWFDRCQQRQPKRSQFGWTHPFNNFYDEDATFASAIDCEDSAEAYIEANYFKNLSGNGPNTADAGTKAKDGGGNILDNSPGIDERDPGDVFVPSSFYNYRVDAASTLPTTIPAGAGVGNI